MNKNKISPLQIAARWAALIMLLSLMSGTSSALFLYALDWITNTREANTWLIWFLPVGGLLIGLMYFYYGKAVSGGNNLLLDGVKDKGSKISWIMAPLVLIGTLLTHLFGGSAGREGTAIQMSSSMADQLSNPFRLNALQRKILLLAAIAGGFAAVFGTPAAGAIFALELLLIRKLLLPALLPVALTAWLSDFVCHLWQVPHTPYRIPFVPDINAEGLLWSAVAGVVFGVVALLFSRLGHLWSQLFNQFIRRMPLRPVIGGVVLMIVIWILGDTRHIGLGIPVIVDSFNQPVYEYDFILKILLTTFTLGAGFKGGEVTPLFFIGSTLGNVLIWFIPLPLALLAGMGFVAVFAGATNTPIACTVMAAELFGYECVPFVLVACITAYLVSGKQGIYASQPVPMLKWERYYKR